MIVDVLLLAGVLYVVATLAGWTCFFHEWHEHGPTYHMALHIDENKIVGHKRMWWVCGKCGAKRRGRKIED